LFWLRVAAVDQSVRVVREDPAAVQQQLALPPISKSKVGCAEDKLREASRNLVLAVFYTAAASLLARCRLGLVAQGRVAATAARVHDDDLAVPPHSESPRARGEEAFDARDRCRGHLGAVKRLLHHKIVPGMADHVDAEHAAAVVGELEATRQLMADIDAYISASISEGS
uniref:Uncharacterized protein n=1 Tax=Oryza brachyantha TaxID=4533 RepID=J3KWK7_ORYBR